MAKAALTAIVLFCILPSFGQQPSLFKITRNDKVGYINKKGKIIIAPVFRNGNDFSEGLAAVRKDGLYGFINEKGKFIIPAEYDFATSFVNGLTVAYKDGKPLFIDKKGTVVLPPVYASLYLMNSTKGIITTRTGREGVIDLQTKKLIVDTIYSSISGFVNGVSIVYDYDPTKIKQTKDRVAVIDSSGKIIVPYGQYETINPFIDGFASVEIADKDNENGDMDGAIDAKGTLLFKRPYQNSISVRGNFHNGYARMSLYKYWLQKNKNEAYRSDRIYEGYINLKGELAFNDSTCNAVSDFSNNRAFIRRDGEEFTLIDTDFKRVGDKIFRRIISETFNNGYAIVDTRHGLGIIDTSGKFVTRSDYDNIASIGIIDDYFFFSQKTDGGVYGVADLKGNVIIEPMFDEFDRNGFVNGLIKAMIDDTLCYVNKSGDIVWQQKDVPAKTLQSLNTEFMTRGYFYAYSTPKNSEGNESGGWATSSNIPKPINAASFPGGSLAITIDINKPDTFATAFNGYTLYVSNTTADTIAFNAQDSRLYMRLQAKDKEGRWRDIEYLPRSWCGNSYHIIELEPNAFWTFTIPEYEGEFNTKIRAKLQYNGKADPEKQLLIYSNEIEGSINPGQFWNKRQYSPSGLMDPYNE